MKAIIDLKWVIIALGVLLVLASFISGISRSSILFWFSIISGVVIIVLGWFNLYICASVVGLIVFGMPWIFSFSATPAATWYLVIGEATLLLAGNRATQQWAGPKGLLAYHDETSEGPQQNKG